MKNIAYTNKLFAEIAGNCPSVSTRQNPVQGQFSDASERIFRQYVMTS